MKSNAQEVKRRIRLGVTNSMRTVFQQFLSGGYDLFLANCGIYSQFFSNESSQNIELEELICKDVPHTFSSYEFFQMEDGPAKRSLHNVLKAYSFYDREVGYTQWMKFILGMFLFSMKEEELFWAMVGLLNGRGKIRGQYFHGFPLLRKHLFQFEMLMKEKLPQHDNHFKEETQ